MDEVASRAGISKVLLYRHVEGKADLYRSVLQHTLAEMATEFDSGVAVGAPHSAIRAVLAVARRNPHGVRLLVRHASREPEFAAYATELRARVVDAFVPMLAPRVDDEANLHWLVELTVTLVWEGVLGWIDDGSGDDEQFVERFGAGVQAAVQEWSGS
jgi:AcrR family transcriptional regulator